MLTPNFLYDRSVSSPKGIMGQRRKLSSMPGETMSAYINETWAHKHGALLDSESHSVLGERQRRNDLRLPLLLTRASLRGARRRYEGVGRLVPAD